MKHKPVIALWWTNDVIDTLFTNDLKYFCTATDISVISLANLKVGF